MARALQMNIVALTGEGGGDMARLADILLDVPEKRVARVQEIHICLYHYLCEKVEAACVGR